MVRRFLRSRCWVNAASRPKVVTMASTEEVTVSVGDMVVVKAEDEADSDDPNKTQVILQLQPISAGYVPQHRPHQQNLWFWF